MDFVERVDVAIRFVYFLDYSAKRLFIEGLAIRADVVHGSLAANDILLIK